MKVAVFDAAQRILGWLTLGDAVERYATFTVRLLPEPGTPFAPPGAPLGYDPRRNFLDEGQARPTLELAIFEWRQMAARDREDKLFVCDVLIFKEQHSKLNRVSGFCWFAKEHGRLVEQSR